MKQELVGKISAILARCADMSIATVRPDGAPQATVVSYVNDGLTIYFGCGAGSQKAANLARDRRVSATVTAPYDDWMEISGVSMAAVADEVTVPSEKESVGRMMFQRFPQISAIQPAEAGAVKLFRLTPTIISLLDYGQGFGHTETFSVDAADLAGISPAARHQWVGAA